jgi:hypothetical protein
MTKLSTMAAVVVLMAGLVGFAAADQAKEKEAAKEKAKDTNGSITDAQVGEMLTNMGYESTKGTYKSGACYYDVKLTTQDFTFSVRLALSPNQRVVWMMAYLDELPKDVSAEKLKGLLQAVNSKTGKMQFRMTENSLKADQPMDNFGVTPARLKRELEDFAASLQDTKSLWTAKKADVKAEEKKADVKAEEKK